MSAFNPHSLEPFWDAWYIDSLIGEGSFGSVYKIYREEFGTKHYSALKIISVPKTESEEKQVFYEGMDEKSATQYFHDIVEVIYKEISIMSELKGKTNIVSYEDHKIVQKQEGVGFHILIRMELLESLNDYIMRTKFSAEQVVNLGKDLCKALVLCQKRNLIHRDIKPANIFVSSDGDFKLGDFGIARQLEGAQDGLSIKGTYGYMAPEVYLGNMYDERVDIYSLGMVLYYFLNNKRGPFTSTTTTAQNYNERQECLRRRFSGEPLPRPVFASDRFAKVVLKACEYDVANRYSTPEEFLKALDELSESDMKIIKGNDNSNINACQDNTTEEVTMIAVSPDQVTAIDESTIGVRTEDNLENDIKFEEDLDGTVMLTNAEDDDHDKTISMDYDESTVQMDAAEVKKIVSTPHNIKKRPKTLLMVAVVSLLVIGGIAAFTLLSDKDKEADKVAPTTNVAVPEEKVVSDLSPAPTEAVIKNVPPYEVTIKKEDVIKDLSSVKDIDKLTSLTVDNNELTSIDRLKASVWLDYLSVENNKLTDIKALAGLNKLTCFNAKDNQINDVSPLKDLLLLEILVLSNNKISNISELGKLTSLSELRVDSNKKLEDISVLSNMKQLETLILSNTGVKDITPLFNLTNLSLLDITNTDIPQDQITEFMEQLNDCVVIQ